MKKVATMLVAACTLYSSALITAAQRHTIQQETVLEVISQFEENDLALSDFFSSSAVKQLDESSQVVLLSFAQMVSGVITMAATKNDPGKQELFEQALHSTFAGFSHMIAAGMQRSSIRAINNSQDIMQILEQIKKTLKKELKKITFHMSQKNQLATQMSNSSRYTRRNRRK